MKRSLVLFVWIGLPLWICGGCSKPAPVLSAMEPTTGPTGGATEVTLRGRGFEPGMKVAIGDRPASVVSMAPDGGSVVFMTPGGPPGAQDVVVQVGDGGQPSMPLTFTYEPLRLVKLFPAGNEVLTAEDAPVEIYAEFSQAIEPEGAQLILVGSDAQSWYDPDTQSLVLALDPPPAAGTSHGIRMSGIKDLAGNPMPELTSTFTVEAKPNRSTRRRAANPGS